jgi:hypothetical protein
MTATTTTTIAAIAVPAASISRLQACESGHGQRACQQPKDAAARGGVVGVGQLLRKLLNIHFERNSLIDWEAIRLQIRRHSCSWRLYVPGRGAVMGYRWGSGWLRRDVPAMLSSSH